MKKILISLIAIGAFLLPISVLGVTTVPVRYDVNTNDAYLYPLGYRAELGLGTTTPRAKVETVAFGVGIEGPYNGPLNGYAEENNIPTNYRLGDVIIYRIYSMYYNATTNNVFYSNTYTETDPITITNTFAAVDVYWEQLEGGTNIGYLITRDLNDGGFVSYVTVGDVDTFYDDYCAGVSICWQNTVPDLDDTTANKHLNALLSYRVGDLGYGLYTPNAVYIGENLGIGTTSPYAKLSVVGQAVAQYFTATSTTATSTFPVITTTSLNIPALGAAAGTFLAADPNGRVIATTTPAGGGGSGTVTAGLYGQVAWYAGSGTSVSGTSSQLTIGNLLATSTTATSTFKGGFNAGGATGLNVYPNGPVRIGNAVPNENTAPFSVETGSGTEVRLGMFNTTAATQRSEFTVANSASTNWTNNFCSMMIHGGSYAGNNYLGTGHGATDAGLALLSCQGGALTGLGINVYTADPLIFGTSDTPRMQITSGGNVAIGGTSSALPTATSLFNVGNTAQFQVTSAGLMLAPAGSAANPSHSFVGDPNSGGHNPAADTYAIAVGGVTEIYFDGTGTYSMNPYYASTTAVSIADKVIANTAASSTLFTDATWSRRTYGANFLKAGSQICFDMKGLYNTPIGTPSATVRIALGTGAATTTLVQKTTTGLASGASNLAFDGDGCITIRTVGASGTVQADGAVTYETAAGTSKRELLRGRSTIINTTVAQTLDVTLEWDSASTDRIATSTQSSAWIK